MKEIKKILVPVDFSKPSTKAVQYAFELCKKINAKMEMLHVIEFEAVTLYGAMPIVPSSSLEAGFKAGAQKLMNRLLKHMKNPKQVTSKIISGYGSTPDTICGEAKRFGSDWIVMATHGRTGLKHLMLGSVAEKVLRIAPCPVLTVRWKG